MKLYPLLFLLFPPLIFGRPRQDLKGKVNADANSLRGVTVINIASDQAVVTTDGGYFEIAAMEGDSLMFSSTLFKARKIRVTAADFSALPLIVKLVPIPFQLDEVTIFQYKNINAVSLGIVSKNIKRYTPAERRFKTAMDYDAQIGLNTSLSIDPFLNMISGRSAMLLKDIAVERKQALMAKVENTFEHSHFTARLKIPEEYVKGFLFYIAENTKFTDALDGKNVSMATFIMGELAVKYLEDIACE